MSRIWMIFRIYSKSSYKPHWKAVLKLSLTRNSAIPNTTTATKTVNGTTTSYVWNGRNLASETKNNATTVYYYDPLGVNGAKTDNDTFVRYIKDPHGNVVATSKNSALYGTYDYTAFGNQLEATDTTNPFRYCGEYYDEESGLTYLRNRYYNSNTGRFLTEDPIRDGLNWYVYCSGNPVNAWDSSGLLKIDLESADLYNKKYENEDYISIIEGYLNELSDDKIAVNRVTGEVNIIYQEEYLDKPKCTDLVRKVVSKDDFTIEYKENTEWKTSFTDSKKPITVYFDPHYIVPEENSHYVMDGCGNVYLETQTDPIISFSHELGHGYDVMIGNFDNTAGGLANALNSDKKNIIYMAPNGEFKATETEMSEIRNIGLPYISDNGQIIPPSPNQFHENDARTELNYGTVRITATKPL